MLEVGRSFACIVMIFGGERLVSWGSSGKELTLRRRVWMLISSSTSRSVLEMSMYQQRQVWNEEGYPANVQRLRSRTSDEESFIVEWHEDEYGYWSLWSSEHRRWRYAQHEAQDREELLRAWREAEFHQDKRRQWKIEEEWKEWWNWKTDVARAQRFQTLQIDSDVSTTTTLRQPAAPTAPASSPVFPVPHISVAASIEAPGPSHVPRRPSTSTRRSPLRRAFKSRARCLSAPTPLVQTPHVPAPPVASLSPLSLPTISITEPKTEVDSEAIRIAAWANVLATSPGNPMDPTVDSFLEQTVHTTCHLAIVTARNPKLEDVIAKMLRPQPLLHRPYLVSPFVAAPTMNVLLSCVVFIAARFHGRLIPFHDFDGRLAVSVDLREETTLRTDPPRQRPLCACSVATLARTIWARAFAGHRQLHKCQGVTP
jgi:hypothetical protein